jgi:hypothetical protein
MDTFIFTLIVVVVLVVVWMYSGIQANHWRQAEEGQQMLAELRRRQEENARRLERPPGMTDVEYANWLWDQPLPSTFMDKEPNE